MTWKIGALAFAVLLSHAAYAQEDLTPLEVTVQICIAPGFVPEGDPFDVVASLPERNCVRACKAAAKGCKDVVKTIDLCGVNFLKATIRVGIEVCRGLGGTPQQCRGVKDAIQPDIDWWRAQGKLERAACDADSQTYCLSRCHDSSALSLPTFTPAIPSPTPAPSGGGVVLESIGMRTSRMIEPIE